MLEKTHDGKLLIRTCYVCQSPLDEDSTNALKAIKHGIREEIGFTITHGLCPQHLESETARLKEEMKELRKAKC